MRTPVIHIVVAVLLDIVAVLLVLSSLGTVVSTAEAAAAGLPTLPPIATVLPAVGLAALFIYLSVGLYSANDWARRVAAGQAWTAVGGAVIGAFGLVFVGGTAARFATAFTPVVPVGLGIGIGAAVTLVVFGGIPLYIALRLNRPDMQELTADNPGQLSGLAGIPIPAAILFYLSSLGGIGSLLQIPGALALPRLASQFAALDPGRTLGDLATGGLDPESLGSLESLAELPVQFNPFEFIPAALPVVVLLAFGVGLLASAYLILRNKKAGVWTFAGIQIAGAVMILAVFGFARSMLAALTSALAAAGVELLPNGPNLAQVSEFGNALTRSFLFAGLVALGLLGAVVVLALRSGFGQSREAGSAGQSRET